MIERTSGVLVALALVACKPTHAEAPWPAFDVSTAEILRGHRVANAAAPTRPPRYQRPSCTPAYEWRATLSTTMDADASAEAITQRIDERATFELRAAPSSSARVELVTTLFQLAMATASGERGAPIEGALPTNVELDLRDGRTWAEANGPRSMWAALGTFSGVALFFPVIPATHRSESWTLTVHAPSEARGGAAPISAIAGIDATRQVLAFRSRIARWITVDGERAAVVQASSTSPDGRSLRVSIETIVTDHGLVLGSAVRIHTLVRSSDEQPTLTWTGDTRAELRLRGGCPGPSLSTGFPLATSRERALVTYRHLLRAVLDDDRAAALSLFDRATLAAHGEDAVWSLLRGYVRDRGPRSLGTVELADDVGRARDGAFALKIHGTGRVRESRNLALDVDLTFAVTDSDVRVRSIGVSSVQGSTEHDLLELDAHAARAATTEVAPSAEPSPRSPFTGLPAVDAGTVHRGIFGALSSSPR